MNATLAELQEQAKRLSPQERAQLAYVLLESLEPHEEGGVEEAWLREVEMRWESIRRGEAKLTPAEEVFAEARRLLR